MLGVKDADSASHIFEEPTIACVERSRISSAIAKAVQDVCIAKAYQDSAIKKKLDAEPYRFALTEARKQGRLLAAELDKHSKEHGC